jgi:hypothetical protein
MILKKEFFNQFNTGQNQYTYFIIAIDASGIGFALNKLDDKVLSYPLIFFLLALASFAFSFFSGIRFHQLKNESYSLEYKNLEILEKNFPGIMDNEDLIKKEIDSLTAKSEIIQIKMFRTYNFLNVFMALGICFFVVYELFLLLSRSNSF